jgi:flagellar FliL protein
MAEEKENDNEKAGEEDAPKKSMLKWIILGGVLIALGAGGFFGWRVFSNPGDPEEASEELVTEEIQVEEEEAEKVILQLEPVVANLVDKLSMGKRYLKITIALELNNEKAMEKVSRYQPQIKDTILMLLTSQTFDEIRTIEGKLDLKQTLLTRINQAVGNRIVHRIYFTEFVVQ